MYISKMEFWKLTVFTHIILWFDSKRHQLNLKTSSLFIIETMTLLKGNRTVYSWHRLFVGGDLVCNNNFSSPIQYYYFILLLVKLKVCSLSNTGALLGICRSSNSHTVTTQVKWRYLTADVKILRKIYGKNVTASLQDFTSLKDSRFHSASILMGVTVVCIVTRLVAE